MQNRAGALETRAEARLRGGYIELDTHLLVLSRCRLEAPIVFSTLWKNAFCAHGGMEGVRAVADLLARGLSGDDGDLRAVVEMAVEELRSLSCARADAVLKV